mgnify:CR=1 FL=1
MDEAQNPQPQPQQPPQLPPSPPEAIIPEVVTSDEELKRRQKNPRRYTVITEAIIEKLEAAFSIDATDGEACAYAQISEASYYGHMKSDQTFADRMAAAKYMSILRVKKVVSRVIQEGDGKLALKFLELRQRENYHKKIEEEVTQNTVEQLLDDVEKGTEYPKQKGKDVESHHEPEQNPGTPVAT